jgi:hypothetical protein
MAFRTIASGVCILSLMLSFRTAHAQGGPPYLTNDPGTPGNANWEINIAAAPTITRDVRSYQLPQFDINFGLGDRIQLTYEIPYVLQTSTGQPSQTAWGNALPGVKWRFFDQGEKGWQLSTFPQLETSGSSEAQRKGIAAPGPRFLLPLEVQKRVGPLDMNFEAGYFFPWNGPNERILGFVAGRQITPKFEWDGEIYNDKVMGASSQNTMFDLGGRYKITPAFVFLFMAGRSFSGNSSGQPEFMGYFGIQILLSRYGRTLTKE